ncbi:glycosyltransferase family 9 protein [bacterium]|nr:glycosyltransferase family 9 protein [bacterium]
MSGLDRSGPSASAEAVLVIRFSSLGDVLLAGPALRALRARFPNSRIDFLTAKEYAAAAALLSGSDRILTFDRRRGLGGLLRLRRDLSRRYTVLVDLQNSPRSAFLRTTTLPVFWVKAKRYRFRRWLLIHLKWDLYGETKPVPIRYLDAAAMVGGQDDGGGLELRVPEDARTWASDFVARHGEGRRLAVLCPGARHFTKRWPAERWMEVGRELSASNWFVTAVGSGAEEQLLHTVAETVRGAAILQDRSIPEIAALMEKAAVVISNDSGLMHLAGGVRAPLVALFGPTVRHFGFYPFRANAVVLDHELSCRPCRALGGPKCPKTHFRCMLNTSPAEVLAAIDALPGGTT